MKYNKQYKFQNNEDFNKMFDNPHLILVCKLILGYNEI